MHVSLSLLMVIRLAFITPWVLRPSRISSSDECNSSDSEMTPRTVFRFLCGVIEIGIPSSVLANRKDLVCVVVKVSIRKSPDLSFLIDFGSPPIPMIPLCIEKGDIPESDCYVLIADMIK
ncbi:hypothetical protein AVEN_33010-1 [Araneus ventricosus]|uniref:Secreted protein n=1 Tax=Araneus ventricosus TaxID=182803 RepID=A0A4Y2QJQ3_ARAVE|nr:hypothetical protein AVEN_33010-1 [Araneus ventricosus]